LIGLNAQPSRLGKQNGSVKSMTRQMALKYGVQEHDVFIALKYLYPPFHCRVWVTEGEGYTTGLAPLLTTSSLKFAFKKFKIFWKHYVVSQFLQR